MPNTPTPPPAPDRALRNRGHLPLAVTFLLMGILYSRGPVQQFLDYHRFADQRAWLGVPNAANVLTNLPFALVGLLGLALLWRGWGHPGVRASRVGYALFFGALFLTAFGSGWYHLAPDNGRLILDRLPIALACAGILAAVRNETMGANWWFTPLATGFALFSVYWWRYTDLQGVGDLRPYIYVQLLPLLLIPLLQWQAKVPLPERRLFAGAVVLYLLAKLCELGDHALYGALGGIGGHGLKHLLAAGASALVAWSLARRLA